MHQLTPRLHQPNLTVVPGVVYVASKSVYLEGFVRINSTIGLRSNNL